MQSQFIYPSEPLRPYVDRYIAIRASSGASAPLRVLPSPQSSVAFNCTGVQSNVVVLGEPVRDCPPRSISGYFTGAKEYHTCTGGVDLLVVVFKPWGATRLTRLPIHEITNLNIDLEHSHGRIVHEVEERLRECDSLRERIATLEEFLLANVRDGGIDRLAMDAVAQIARGNGTLMVESLARTYGLSRRQFDRRFREAIGISPKLFSRLIRFQRMIGLLKQGSLWSDIVVRTGLHDQAHLIREFRAFTGSTPSAFVASRARTPVGMQTDEEICAASPYASELYA